MAVEHKRKAERMNCFAAALCALVIGLLAASTASARQTVWSLTPYDIRVVVALDDSPQLTPQLQADLCRQIESRCDALIGAPWRLTAEPAQGRLRTEIVERMDEMVFESLPEELLEVDKVILLAVLADDGRLRIEARDVDVRTQVTSLPVSVPVWQSGKLADAALSAVVKAFSPLARVDKVAGDELVLQPKAAALPLRDESISLVSPGMVFQPVLRHNNREGKPRRIVVVPWTACLVERADSEGLTCRLYSGLRGAVSSRRRGRIERLAVAVTSPQTPTTLILASNIEPEKRLSGYDVFSHPPGAKAAEHLGRTDRLGRIEIPPSDDPLRVLLIRNGGVPLARLPLIPGLHPEMTVAMTDDSDRLEAEGVIVGLQEQLVDLVTRREVLVARANARIGEGKIDEAKDLLSQIRGLPTAVAFSQTLDDAKQRISSSDPTVQARIDVLFGDTRKLVLAHLDEKPVENLSRRITKAETAGQ